MNPFFQSFKNQQTTPNPISIPAPPQNLGQLLSQVAQSIMPFGMNSEQLVRQLVQNGRMTQDQFNQYAQIADSWTGRNS